MQHGPVRVALLLTLPLIGCDDTRNVSDAGSDAGEVAMDAGGGACSGAAGTMVGQCPPDFRLPAWDGSTWDLAAQRGSVVVVHVVAGWAGPASTSSMNIESLRADHPGVVFVDVVVADPTADAPTEAYAMTWRSNNGLGYPVLYDSARTLQTEWVMSDAIPFAMVIGPEGAVIARAEGGGEISDAIAAL